MSLVAPQATGKTTIALALCERIGAVRVNGDAVKADIWGDLSTANRRDGEHRQRHDQAYEIVYRQAEQALAAGKHLVRDYIHDTALERARALAGAYNVLAWLHVPVDVAVARYLSRCETDPDRRDIVRGDRRKAAESIRRVEAKLALEPPPPPRCVRLDAARPTDELVTDLLAAVSYPCSSNPRPAPGAAQPTHAPDRHQPTQHQPLNHHLTVPSVDSGFRGSPARSYVATAAVGCVCADDKARRYRNGAGNLFGYERLAPLEHRDRLALFGFEKVETWLRRCGGAAAVSLCVPDRVTLDVDVVSEGMSMALPRAANRIRQQPQVPNVVTGSFQHGAVVVGVSRD